MKIISRVGRIEGENGAYVAVDIKGLTHNRVYESLGYENFEFKIKNDLGQLVCVNCRYFGIV